MASKKKDLALLIGIGGPKKADDDDDMGGDQDPDAIRAKALKSYKLMVEANAKGDFKAGLKAFDALHGFTHALMDMGEDVVEDGEDEEESADEYMEEAESEEDEA